MTALALQTLHHTAEDTAMLGGEDLDLFTTGLAATGADPLIGEGLSLFTTGLASGRVDRVTGEGLSLFTTGLLTPTGA